MIFWQLIYTYLIIGAFTFGGGYSMIALIQDEVVNHHGWMTLAEFADLLAISQITPGPVGINTATYSGYTAVAAAGYPQWAAVCGALLASASVIVVPVTLLLLISRWIAAHKNDKTVASVMRLLRITVIGVIAAAAIGLMNNESFGDHSDMPRLITSIVIFGAVFALSVSKKVSPVYLIVASGVASLVVYSI